MKKIENHWAGVMERKQEAESATLTPSQFAVTVGNSFSFLSLDLFMQNERSFRLPITQDHCKSNRRVLAKLLRRKKWEPLTYSFNQRFLWTQGMPQTPSLAQGWGDGGGGGRSLRLTCCHQMGLHQIQEMHGDSYRRGERWPSPAAPAVK